MSKRFRTCSLDQDFLLPPSLKDWLPENHLAHFIAGVIGELDLRPMHETYQRRDGRGKAAFHPTMMVRLLLYAYCIGVRSSRNIEKATYDNVAFRYLAADEHPDHDTIAAFRRTHLKQLTSLFVQVVRLCKKAGLVKLGYVAIDGSKIRANASGEESFRYDKLQAEEQSLSAQIREIMQKAEEVDAAEDAQYGRGRRGEELPEDLNTINKQLEKIRAAKAALEQEARQRAEQVRKEREATAGKGRSEAAKKRWSRHRSGVPKSGTQANLTDPDSRVMLDGGQHSFVQGYNAQIAVDGDSQVIVAAVVTQTPEDRQQLVPMVEAVKQTAGHKPKTVAADAGYWSTAAVEQVRKKNIRALVPPERTQHSTATHNRAKTEAAERMRKVLSRKPGRMAYAHRQGCVEPVFGILKEFRGYRRFHLRGLENVNGEWALMCLGHNLRKLCAHRARTAA